MSLSVLLTMVIVQAVIYLVVLSMLMLNYQRSAQQLREVQADQRDQIRELLNRIQSKDLHAFATMQANTNAPVSSDEPMYPRSDEAEARRMVEMYGGVEGVGDVIYTEEEQDLLSDLGFRG